MAVRRGGHRPGRSSAWRRTLSDAVLRDVPDGTAGKDRAREILAAGRRPSTWNAYTGKFATFVHFCCDVQRAAGVPELCPLPAHPTTVVLYLGWLQEQDRVHHGSLQQYLTAINQAHVDVGFDKPAVGHHVALAKKGFGELEAELLGALEQRGGLPAWVVLRALHLGLETDDPELLRATTAVVVSFCFFARGDTCTLAVPGRLVVDERGIHFSEDAKNLERMRPETLSIPWPATQELRARSPHALLGRFLHWRATVWKSPPPAGASIWLLPGEQLLGSAPATLGKWLDSITAHLGIEPPPGVKWTGHSLRGGAATAALALGVSLPVLCRWGLWRSITVIMRYLDPLVKPDAAALLFFAHLLASAPSFDDAAVRAHLCQRHHIVSA